jgi:hypothetical protein
MQQSCVMDETFRCDGASDSYPSAVQNEPENTKALTQTKHHLNLAHLPQTSLFPKMMKQIPCDITSSRRGYPKQG